MVNNEQNDILIPLENLQQGFDLCKKQMEMLIESSEILYNSKKYPISIALSILAREESAKLELISIHITLSSGIKKNEWSSLSKGFVHENKLVNPIKFAIESSERMGKDLFEDAKNWRLDQGYPQLSANYEDVLFLKKLGYDRFLSLNTIKKECFYLDWKDSSWKVFLNRSKEQLEALSFIELTSMKFLLYGFIIGNLQSRKKDEEIQKELDAVKEKFHQIENVMKTKQYKIKTAIAWSVCKQYFKSKP